jgi:hypothetical protein
VDAALAKEKIKQPETNEQAEKHGKDRVRRSSKY